jgi:hypothetical protein
VYSDTRTVYVYRSLREVRALDEHGALDGEGVLPGFVFPVRSCFA